MPKTELPIAFQGEPGANSDIAARAFFSGAETLSCATFADVFAAVREHRADYGMIPIDNSLAGRVADIHHLLPDAGVFIVGEHFQPIEHRLLGIAGATLDGVKAARSHVHALAQCRKYLQEHGVKPVVTEDTAGAAREVSEFKDPSVAAIASPLAGELYGLTELARDIEDGPGNTTRFIVISRESITPEPGSGSLITSFFFTLRSVPAALYKALGGFATNGVNLLKLESYLDGDFRTAKFYEEAEGHPDDPAMRRALEELRFFTEDVRILGTYAASPARESSAS